MPGNFTGLDDRGLRDASGHHGALTQPPRTAHRPAPMSALDGWVDICRTGVWRDATGRIVNMDEARLAAIAADYASADPAPAVIGHPAIDAPAYAWAESVRKVGDRLQAKFRNIEPAFLRLG